MGASIIVIMSLGLITKTDVNKLKEAWYALIHIDKHESILERWNAECNWADKWNENTSLNDKIKEITWQWLLVGRSPDKSINLAANGQDSFLRKMRKGGRINDVAYEAFGQYFNEGVNVDREAFHAGFMKMAEFDEAISAHVIRVAEFLRSRPEVKIWIPSHSNFEHIGYILGKFKELGVDDVFAAHFDMDARELYEAKGKAAFMLSPFLAEPDQHSEMMLEVLASGKVELPPGSQVVSLLNTIKPDAVRVKDFFEEKCCPFKYIDIGKNFEGLFGLPSFEEMNRKNAEATLNVSQAMFTSVASSSNSALVENVSPKT